MEGFFPRTYLTTAWVAAVLGLGVWATLGWERAVGFLAGVAIGLVFVAAIVTVVTALVRAPREQRPRRRWPYGFLYVGKYAVAAGGLYLLSRWSVEALMFAAAGIGLPLVIMVLKMVGTELNRRMGVDGPGRPAE